MGEHLAYDTVSRLGLQMSDIHAGKWMLTVSTFATRIVAKFTHGRFSLSTDRPLNRLIYSLAFGCYIVNCVQNISIIICLFFIFIVILIDSDITLSLNLFVVECDNSEQYCTLDSLILVMWKRGIELIPVK